MTVYIIVIAVFLILCLAGEEMKKNRQWLLLAMTLFLIAFAGFRGNDVSKDHSIFQAFYDKALPFQTLFSNPGAFFKAAKVEPTFLILASFIKTYLPGWGFTFLMVLFAFLSVTLKVKAIVKYSEFIFLSLFIYLCNTYMLHEFIQVRAGLAAALAMLAFEPLVERKPWKYLLIMLLAILVHYSAIIFLPFYFLNTKKINPVVYIAVIVVPFLLSVFHFDPISLLLKYDLGVYSEKLSIYITEQLRLKHAINKINLTIIFQLILSVFLLFYRTDLLEKNKYSVLFLKINMISVGVFYLFFGLPVFAFRLWEMLNVVQIFLIPTLIYYIKPRWIPELIIVLVGIAIYYNLVLQGHIREYSLIF